MQRFVWPLRPRHEQAFAHARASFEAAEFRYLACNRYLPPLVESRAVNFEDAADNSVENAASLFIFRRRGKRLRGSWRVE